MTKIEDTLAHVENLLHALNTTLKRDYILIRRPILGEQMSPITSNMIPARQKKLLKLVLEKLS